MRAVGCIMTVLMLAGLAGCASDKAFEEGKRLIAEGKMTPGLTSLEQAAREEPDNLEIRTVLARQREAVAGRLLTDADNARLSGKLDAAQQGYHDVLGINPRNERAHAGLAALDVERRHAAKIKHVETLLAHNNLSGAETEIQSVLQENPMQRDARRLMKQITEELAGEKTETVLKTDFKQSLTLEFRDTHLKSVFEIIARTAGINFVFDKDIKQDTKITILIRNSNINDVLKLLLMTNQLAYKVLNENSLLIYPNTAAKQKEYQELMVRGFYVANTDVKQIVAMVKGLVKTKDIYVDEKLNLFVMKDTPEAIRLVERLVALNDLADPEVMLEVEVLEIARNLLLNLGLRYPDSINVSMLNAAGAAAGLPNPIPPFQINSGGINGNGFSIDGLTAVITNPAVLINLKQQNGIINVLANPRIRVKNRQKAKILIGDKVPVVTTTATANVGVASSVSYLDVGLKLDVEPIVSLGDEVSINVSLEVSNIVKEVPITNGGLAYQVGTRTATTTLALKDGETQILAGLINDSERTTFDKIPGLGDLPWVGRLFSSQNHTRNKTEIALLITPRIVRNIARPSRPDSQLSFGTENAAGMFPVTIAKMAPRSLAMSSSSSAAVVARPVVRPEEPSDEPKGEPARSAAQTAPPPVLTLTAPTEASPGKEFTVNISLAGGESVPAAELELNYDASALEALDEGAKTGARLLQLSKSEGAAATAEVRFKVIAVESGSTRITVQNLSLPGESEMAAQVTLPPAANIDIR